VPRYKITVEYDGGPFVGWQRQDSGPSVQAAIEEAVFALSGERAPVHGAGRTDAGVHAIGQVAHFDLAVAKRAEEVRGGLTFHLKPHPIVVRSAETAPDGFHAASRRPAALPLSYPEPRTPPALARGHVWHVPVPLDSGAMQAAAEGLVGRHDFNSFPLDQLPGQVIVKTLDELAVTRCGEEIRIDVGARSFLHNQVRILVGTLQLVGRGQWSKADVEAALAACDRTRAGPTAPPLGLCLLEVKLTYGRRGGGADPRKRLTRTSRK
jgi:tRNA pseudouridine38-40 synthase